MRIPEPKKKSQKQSDETPYKYGAVIAYLTAEPSAVVRYFSKKFVSDDVVFCDEDSGIDGIEPHPHVTIMYGIKDNLDKIQDCCEDWGDLKFICGKVDIFNTNPDFDVLVIRAESPEARGLNKVIDEYCDCEDLYASYEPHITIAYVKKGSCDSMIGNEFFQGMEDIIDRVVFSARDGSETDIYL